MTKIEWTDETWNPIVGCSIQSTGCTNCYAMKQAARIVAMTKGKTHYADTTKYVNGNAVWTGKIKIAPYQTFYKPTQWKKPKRIFVNSMGDIFHENVPEEWIENVFRVIQGCPQHTFMILTKNPKRMRQFMIWWKQQFTDILPNVWLGVSVENQETANERIPILLDTPAATHFISCEPLLGAIDLTKLHYDKKNENFYLDAIEGSNYDTIQAQTNKLDWVIVGGESGKNARPMHPDWVRTIRDQCAQALTPFFFKQWGEFCPPIIKIPGMAIDKLGRLYNAWDEEFTKGSAHVVRIGKKLAGNMLDGKTHQAFPKIGGEA